MTASREALSAGCFGTAGGHVAGGWLGPKIARTIAAPTTHRACPISAKIKIPSANRHRPPSSSGITRPLRRTDGLQSYPLRRDAERSITRLAAGCPTHVQACVQSRFTRIAYDVALRKRGRPGEECE